MQELAELEVPKIALSVARESVAKQQADIRDLRTAAAALLTGDSVVVSFLGGRALDVHMFPGLVAAGVLLFVLSLVLIITVLIPSRRRGIKEIASGSDLFDLTPDPVHTSVDPVHTSVDPVHTSVDPVHTSVDPVHTSADPVHTSADAYVRLTQTYDDIYEQNDRPKHRLVQRLVVAAILVVLQIGAWGATIVLADRKGAGSTNTRLPAIIGTARAGPRLPAISGTARAGRKLSCSTGAWTNAPTSFTYQWSRDRTPIQGGTASAYAVQSSDEELTLTCTVTASNAAGPGSPATSHGEAVAVPHVARCPAATGTLGGPTLGLVRLGMTRSNARRAYKHSSDRGRRYEDFFCLTPIGVRVGYASPKLLATLPKAQRGRLEGRVMWASTSSAYYAIHDIRVGATISAAAKTLGTRAGFHVGGNIWYLTPNGAATAVLKVRHGIVEEIGIGDRQLTRGHTAQAAFLRSFS